MALSPAFKNATRRCLLATAAAATLMAGNAFAQDAESAASDTPAAQPAETASRHESRAPRTTISLDAASCMETTTTNNRLRGLLTIFGGNHNKVKSEYNEACGRDKVTAAMAPHLMTAVTSDGQPDLGLRALGIELYLQQSADAKALIDRVLEQDYNTDFKSIVFSTTNSGAEVRCVSQPAPAALDTADAQSVTNVSFRCTPR